MCTNRLKKILLLCTITLVLLALIVLIVWKSRSNVDEDCQSTFGEPIKYLGTKTPYLSDSSQSTIVTPEGCTAQKIWILSRHGTRYPDKGKILDMQNLLPILRDDIINASSNLNQVNGGLCKSELEALKSWQPNPLLNVSKEEWLTEEGEKELFGISKRFQEKFPHLFPNIFSNDTYYFRTTNEERAIESGKSFALAIFSANSSPPVYFQRPIVNDPILHFYQGCDKWIQQVDKNVQVKYETDRFVQSEVYQSLIKNVSVRLLGNSEYGQHEFSAKEIELMYSSCAFETAWNPPNLSPWCSIFTEQEFKVLSYLKDMKEYWEDGYGFPITYQQACTPIKDLVNRFGGLPNGQRNDRSNSNAKTTAYFGHSGTILKLYARLGLFKDIQNLTSDNFEQVAQHRKWNTGKISPFAANIAFVLFHCPKEQGEEQYQMASLVQERHQQMPACDDQWICSLKKFTTYFQNIVDNCNLDEICRVP